MWCWFTDFLTLLCTSLSKEPSRWNEILIKGIHMVYCWTFRTLTAFPSDAGQRTQSHLKIRCLDTNVICQGKIISARDQLNTCILLSCPFDGLFFFFFRGTLFIHLSIFFLPNVAWKLYVITLCSKGKLFLKIQQSVIALGTGQLTAASSLRLANPQVCRSRFTGLTYQLLLKPFFLVWHQSGFSEQGGHQGDFWLISILLVFWLQATVWNSLAVKV